MNGVPVVSRVNEVNQVYQESVVLQDQLVKRADKVTKASLVNPEIKVKLD